VNHLGIILRSAQDLTRGVYVERLSEVAVSSLAEAFQVHSRNRLTGNDWYDKLRLIMVNYVESR
jgi:hypothetical protein